jgi:hypothetical protein
LKASDNQKVPHGGFRGVEEEEDFFNSPWNSIFYEG